MKIITLIHITAKLPKSFSHLEAQAIKFETLLCCRMQTVPISTEIYASKLRKLVRNCFRISLPSSREIIVGVLLLVNSSFNCNCFIDPFIDEQK